MTYDTIIYARVSTGEQDLHQQEEKLWEYATTDLELNPANIDILTDKSTGTTTDRSSYREMMTRVREGEVDLIIARSLTRLGCNMRDLPDI